MEILKNAHPNIWDKIKGDPNPLINSISGPEWNDTIKQIDYKNFASISELRTKPNSVIGDKVRTTSRDNDEHGGGGNFECISIDASGDSITDNGGTIIVTSDNAAYKMIGTDFEVNINVFGAKGGVKFSNLKNIYIPPDKNPIGVVPDCTDAVNRAIAWLDRDRVVFPASATNFNIPPRKLLVNDHYLINPQGLNPENDVAITVPNGINIDGIGTFHTNYSGINILLSEHYGTIHRVSVYKQLWLGSANAAEWYVKGGDTEPVDQYSQGIVLDSSRRTIIYTEATGFVQGVRLRDSLAVGTVDNILYLGNILNCRYGISFEPGAVGGWTNQNIVNGGSVKITGYVNRSTTIKTPCSALNIAGDNNIFNNVNLEGNTQYQYVLHDRGGDNIYNNLRFEASTFAGQIYFENQGSLIVGGYGCYPNVTGTISEYENIDGTMSSTKRGHTKNWRVHSSEINKGQIRLSGYGTTTEEPSYTAEITNSQTKEGYLGIGKNNNRLRHIIHGEYRNGAVELHTGSNEFVNLRDLHQRLGIYNDIGLHVTGEMIGIGDWIQESGLWYFATNLYQMGVDFATDLTAGKFELEPPSKEPFLLEDGVLSVPDLRGSKTVVKATETEPEVQKGALKTSFGTFSDFSIQSVNTAELKYNMFLTDNDFLIDTDDTDLLLYSPTIMLRNLDSGGATRTINLTKKTLRYIAGKRIIFYMPPQSPEWDYISFPINLVGIDGGDVLISQGDLVEVIAVIDGSTSNGKLIKLN